MLSTDISWHRTFLERLMLFLSMMSSKKRRLDLALSQPALPNDKLLASASGDQRARLWDAATGAALQMLEGLGDVVRGGGAAVEDGVEVTRSLGFSEL
jgi:WD40 repeat protein